MAVHRLDAAVRPATEEPSGERRSQQACAAVGRIIGRVPLASAPVESGMVVTVRVCRQRVSGGARYELNGAEASGGVQNVLHCRSVRGNRDRAPRPRGSPVLEVVLAGHLPAGGLEELLSTRRPAPPAGNRLGQHVEALRIRQKTVDAPLAGLQNETAAVVNAQEGLQNRPDVRVRQRVET